ncbi:MAG: hypothetical protein H6810_12775 [Phycisphaeraceae bacterium]|nr:MAG: hypothetical protein H6810_12775 [Phycisphaeraceae bacterium]
MPHRQSCFLALLGSAQLAGCTRVESGLDEPEALMTAETIRESGAIGDGIVAALQKFKDQNFVYPEQLDELVPSYLDSIQPPTAGAPRWFYRHIADPPIRDGFVLEFGSLGIFSDGETPFPRWVTDESGAPRWVGQG